MDNFISINPTEAPLARLHDYLLSSIAPRPIAFASTLSAQGVPNLAPFSYFNVFSTRPPILIFSPNRSGRTGTNKDTVINIQETFEVVINIISYSHVEQMNVASAEYPLGINEFEKAGFTPLPSELIKPFRVAEAPVQLECKVQQMIVLGSGGGSGNLIICEVVKIHLNKNIVTEDGKIDAQKLDPIARMGQDYYTRAAVGLFEVKKPTGKILYGYDHLPESVKKSKILTANHLGKLCNVEHLPDIEEVARFYEAEQRLLLLNLVTEEDFHKKAALLLDEKHISTAWFVLLSYLYLHNLSWLR